nr:stress response facilitator SrfA [Pseudomonas aeruginosa]
MAEPQDKYTRRTGRTWADDQATYNRLREEADAARQKLRESGYSGAECDQLRQAAFDLNRKANQYWEQMLSDLRQED